MSLPPSEATSHLARASARVRALCRSFGRHPNWLALSCYALASLGANWPVWPGDPSRLPYCDCDDVIQTTWFLRYVPFALAHHQNLFATHLMEYPAGVDLAQNTTMWLLGLLTAPLTVLSGPVASMNLLRFLALSCSASAMYLVLRRLFACAPACFAGGLLYGFSPYLVAQGATHLDLAFVPLPPVIVYLAFDLTVRQRGRAWRSGLALGLCCAVQFFIAAEVLTTTAIVGCGALVLLAVVRPREISARARHALGGGLVAVGVLAAFLAYPVWMFGHGPNHYVGAAHGKNLLSADLLSAVVPTMNERLAPASWKAVGESFLQTDLHENGAYLGIPLLVLAAYLVLRYWRRLWPAYLALVAVAVYGLELGDRLLVDRHVVATGFELPFAILGHIGLVDDLEPIRFSLYTMGILAVLVAYGIDAFAGDLPHRRGRVSSRAALGRALATGLGALVALSLVPAWPYPSVSVAAAEPVRAVDLSHVPQGSVVLSYPFASAYTPNAMYWQAESDFRFRLLGGYALIYGGKRAREYPWPLRPYVIEAIFQQSYLENELLLPHVVASPATDNPVYAGLLDRFCANNEVGAIVVQLGARRSDAIVALVRRALGPPTYRGRSVAIWASAHGPLRPRGHPADR